MSFPLPQVDRTTISQRRRNGIAREDRVNGLGGLGHGPHPNTGHPGGVSSSHDLHHEFYEEPLLSSILHRRSSPTAGREEGNGSTVGMNGLVTGGSSSSGAGVLPGRGAANVSPRGPHGMAIKEAGLGRTGPAGAPPVRTWAFGTPETSETEEEIGEWEEGACQPLWLSLVILFRALDQGFLEQQKPAIAALLGSSVEGADNGLIASLASEYCLKWVGFPASPVNLSEQIMIYNRVCNLGRRYPDRYRHIIHHRFGLLAERIGNINLLSMSSTAGGGVFGHVSRKGGDERKNKSFANNENKLGFLGLFSPVKTLRDGCRRRVFNAWGR